MNENEKFEIFLNKLEEKQLNFIIQSGQYKNKLLKDIIKNDKQYVKWCYKENKVISSVIKEIDIKNKNDTVKISKTKNKYMIGNQEFTSQDKAIAYFREEILKKVGYTNSVKEANLELYNIIKDVLKNHPDALTKGVVDEFNNIILKDIILVENLTNKGTYHMQIINKDDKYVDISWNKAITKKETSCIDKLKSALRQSIFYQIKNFRDITEKICSLCKSTNNLEVDHENPTFKQLVEQFLINKTYPTIFNKIDRNTENKNESYYIFVEENKEFENEWKNFHLKNSKLRFLCKICHNKRSKDGL